MKTHPFAMPSPAVRRLRRATLAREKALAEALEDQKRCPHRGATQGIDLFRTTNGYGSARTITRPQFTCPRCGLREVAWSQGASLSFAQAVILPGPEASQIGPAIDPRFDTSSRYDD